MARRRGGRAPWRRAPASSAAPCVTCANTIHSARAGTPRPSQRSAVDAQRGALHDLQREVGQHERGERDEERRHREHREQLGEHGEAHRGRDLAVGQHGEEGLGPVRRRRRRRPEPRPDGAARSQGTMAMTPDSVLAGRGAARAIGLPAGRAENRGGDLEERVDRVVVAGQAARTGRVFVRAAGRSSTGDLASVVLAHGAPRGEIVAGNAGESRIVRQRWSAVDWRRGRRRGRLRARIVSAASRRRAGAAGWAGRRGCRRSRRPRRRPQRDAARGVEPPCPIDAHGAERRGAGRVHEQHADRDERDAGQERDGDARAAHLVDAAAREHEREEHEPRDRRRPEEAA